MLGSELLDVAIGMVFVYLLLSLICSAANELIETRLKNRSKDLEQGIIGLLNGHSDLVGKIYNHGMIFGLYRGTYDDAKKNKTLPSYIPSKNFALALTDILGSANAAPATIDRVRAAVNQITNLPVKSALLTMLNDAGADIDKFRKSLEDWFNSAMDRVSGWYKRRTHVVIFSLGGVIAISMNVNSISLAQDLWTNKATRDALVGAAQGYLEKHPAPTHADTPSPDASAAAGATGKAKNSGANSSGPKLDDGLQADIDQLKSTNIPIGWSKDVLENLRQNPLLILASLFGWFLTACAASLGAPFWFDVLSKIVVIRSTIKPGEKSAPQPAKA